MGHEIDFSNNRANIAYVGNVPWHGLGDRMLNDASLAEWIAASGLGHSVTSSPIYVQEGGVFVPVPVFQALRRSDTNAPLGVFTDRYVAVQPAQIVEFFQNFILTDPRFTLETAGSLRGGKIIWLLARFEDDLTVVGEKHVAYVLLTTSYDGSLSTIAQASVIRTVCRNTLNASIFDPRAATVKRRHNRVFDGVAMEEAHLELSTVAQSFKAYEKIAEALVGIRISRDQTQKFFEALVPKPEAKKDAKTGEAKTPSLGRYTQTMADLNNLLNKTWNEGAEKNRAWAVFNAVTDFADHVKGVRVTKGSGETEQSSRMHSAFFGDGAQLKSKALRGLLALADTTIEDVVAADGGGEFELAA